MGHFGIGNRVERLEDDRFLTGQAKYLDDLVFEGCLHAVFVRSDLAHARITSIEIGEALAVSGVVAVLTSDDLQKDNICNLPSLASDWVELNREDGSPCFSPDRPLLSEGKVRYVGEAIAMVIAETELAAQDGAARVIINYEALDAVTDAQTAHYSKTASLFEEVSDNTSFFYRTGDMKATNTILEQAHDIVTLDLVNNRVVVNPLEARGAVGQYDKNSDRYLLHCDTQHPYDVRKQTAQCLGVAPTNVRVVSVDVGGGFGIKYIAYAEHALVMWAARKLSKTVKWRSGRTEAFLCDAHARDLIGKASLAIDKDGKFLAIKAELIANLGAYASSHGPVCPTILATLMMPGGYTMPKLAAEVRGVLTNTVPTDAYRGCGQPEGHYILERLVHAAAEKLGLTHDDIRRRNYVRTSDMPYTSAMDVEYDSGDFEANLKDVLGAASWDNISERRMNASRRGKLYGIGLASYVEITGADTREGIEIRFEDNGKVTLNVGTKSSGQGHETVFAQMLNEELGIPFDKIIVRDGDTDDLIHGGGTGGSRSMQMAGTAIHVGSEKVRTKAQELAAHLLEVSPKDVSFQEGIFSVIGTDMSLEIMDLAAASVDIEKLPEGMEPGLNTVVDMEHESSTFPNGSHICEVEVDPDTGNVEVVGYFAVSDYGRVMNPSLLEGQVHGGVAQGIGQALYENGHYDDSGQLTTASYMDYTMPRADNFPQFKLDFTTTPATSNPLGAKGCGEAGAIAAPPAVMNAVIDAIGTDISMPATAEKVWKALKKNGSKKAAA